MIDDMKRTATRSDQKINRQLPQAHGRRLWGNGGTLPQKFCLGDAKVSVPQQLLLLVKNTFSILTTILLHCIFPYWSSQMHI